MILKSLNYFENKDKDNFWEIKNVHFFKQNIVVGLNATGKTRLTNIITSLASILSSKVKRVNGNWFLTFKNGNDIIYSFDLQINEGVVEREEIKENDKLLLKRENGNGEIFSKRDNKFHKYNPPIDELTLNVRRDTEDYPFLEEFITWSKNLKAYSFSGVKNDQITIPHRQEGYIDTLTTVPYILKQASDDQDIIDKILYDMNDIGYPLEKVFAKEQPILPNLQNIFTVAVKETNLNCETEQATISNGMFRALCLIVIIEYLLKIEKNGTIIIDDLGEGLDFDRSTKLTQLLFEKTKESDLQIIITSNDRFLINGVDMQYINYLEREGHIVQSFNYYNSKDTFDKFLLSGLNNFDFINPSLSHLKN